MRNIQPAIEKSVAKYPYINKSGAKVKINQALVKAIIYQESRGVPDAKSHAGAYGLTQIMPQTAKLLKCDYNKLNSPELAIDCSVKFLAALLTYNKGDLIKSYPDTTAEPIQPKQRRQQQKDFLPAEYTTTLKQNNMW
jgi:soluble lytic murein transglycosylase-like protein